MKSLLFQGGAEFSEPPGCSALPCRIELTFSLKKDGRIYNFVLRDKVVPEDAHLILVKAAAFAIQTGEAYSGETPKRSVRDFLIKNNVVL